MNSKVIALDLRPDPTLYYEDRESYGLKATFLIPLREESMIPVYIVLIL